MVWRLTEALTEGTASAEERRQAAEMLVPMGDPRARNALLHALHDDDEQTAASAQEGLWTLFCQSHDDDIDARMEEGSHWVSPAYSCVRSCARHARSLHQAGQPGQPISRLARERQPDKVVRRPGIKVDATTSSLPLPPRLPS